RQLDKHLHYCPIIVIFTSIRTFNNCCARVLCLCGVCDVMLGWSPVWDSSLGLNLILFEDR
ncbi:unnamed protein product, partial [Litomosoides sigmodontis]